jgi:hypothetical protein
MVAAGHPVTQQEGGSADTPARSLYDTFVCPRLLRDDGTPASSPNACEKLFYTFVGDRPEARAHFSAYVAGKRDPALAMQVVANLGVTDAGVDLWQALDGDDPSWKAAGPFLE